VWIFLLVADIGIGHGEPEVPVRHLEFPAFVVYGCWPSLWRRGGGPRTGADLGVRGATTWSGRE
jgi:hypothetical protein